MYSSLLPLTVVLSATQS